MIPLLALSISLFALYEVRLSRPSASPTRRRLAAATAATTEFGSEEFWNLCTNLPSEEEPVLEVLRQAKETNPQWHQARDLTLDGYSVLQHACLQGATNVVRYCLEEGSNPNRRTQEHESTPLKWAANRGYKEIVQLLLDHAADEDARDYFGYTPLQYAALGGHSSVLAILLHLEDTTGETMEDMLQLLATFSPRNENVNAIDDETGFRPLHLACGLGRLDLVEALLELGAMADEPTHEGRTPLFFAVSAGHDHLIPTLFDWGAFVGACTHSTKTRHHVANPGWTLLHEASQKNQHECAQLLLERFGMDPNVVTVGKETPLLIAVQNGNLEVAQTLLQDGGVSLNQGDDWNTTPLHDACRQNFPQIVELLLEHGADLCAQNNYNETPLHHCCWLGHVETANLLTQDGDPSLLWEAKNKDQKTPLDYAKERGHTAFRAAMNMA